MVHHLHNPNKRRNMLAAIHGLVPKSFRRSYIKTRPTHNCQASDMPVPFHTTFCIISQLKSQISDVQHSAASFETYSRSPSISSRAFGPLQPIQAPVPDCHITSGNFGALSKHFGGHFRRTEHKMPSLENFLQGIPYSRILSEVNQAAALVTPAGRSRLSLR